MSAPSATPHTPSGPKPRPSHTMIFPVARIAVIVRQEPINELGIEHDIATTPGAAGPRKWANSAAGTDGPTKSTSKPRSRRTR
ncbi:MAG: hypothetical protein WCF36_09290 [Candidatus Nanopelagicales bacterium]